MRRSFAKIALDLAVWGVAAPLAWVVRLDEAVVAYLPHVAWYALVGLGLKALLLSVVRLERRSWHRVGLRDLAPIATAVAIVFALEILIVLATPSEVLFVPRSVPFIEAMVAVLGLAGLRFAARLYYEERGVLRVRLRSEGRVRQVLIAGAGESGVLVARELLRHPEAGRRPVGFVDDDPAKRRRSFAGVPVVGTLADLARAASHTDADEVLVAMPSAPGAVLRRIVEEAREAGIGHRTIPSLHALVSGRVTVSSLREVAVEDLLRRDSVRLDPEPIAATLRGRTVLVTGAGGSIGSEIVRQVALFEPAEIVLLGRGENSIFLAERDIRRLFPDLTLHPVICDVRDERSLRAVFERFHPQVVFHAAAHKHVPLMEANPEQAVFNNVGGTLNLASLAQEFGAERLVNISTDKAVNPTSVMGASKRVAEMTVSHVAQTHEGGCTMVSVRFGNVLGSRGSVVPLFKEQIARGGPVMVTHPDMVRYFMTIPEASQLVLQAAAAARSGRVYVLDMGEPVRIVDLARDLILLSGLEPGRDIEIQFSGVRPGEKLFEELLSAEEGTDASLHEKIFVARKTGPGEGFEARLDALFAAAHRLDRTGIRAAFKAVVPSYALDAPSPVAVVDALPNAPVLPVLPSVAVEASMTAAVE